MADSLGSSDDHAPLAKAGDSSGGAFSDGFKKRLKAALDSLPEAHIDADSTDAEKKVEELRLRMEELLGKEIGVDLSSKEAMAELVKIDTGLEDIRKKSKDIRISFDAAEAGASPALLRADAGKSGDVGGGGIISKIGGLFGGGGAAAPAAGQGAPAAASAGAGLMNPYTITAGVVAP